MWLLNPTSRLPIYKQLMQLVEKNMESGWLAPGERLPSERRLATLLGINRSTVIHALDELVERGILMRKRGSGTYVNSEKWGVQNYALLNWQGPSLVLPGKHEGLLSREAAIVRDEKEKAGEDFHNLSGDSLPLDLLPDLKIPQLSWEGMVAAEKSDEASRLGLLSFRHAVQRFLREARGLSVPLEEILITSGSRQSLFLITQCLLRPGDAVGVEAPSYFYSLPIFQAAGLRLFALPMDSGGISMAGLESAVRRRPLKMIFLNPIFHNPTGSIMKDSRKKAVLAFCAKKHIPVVEDDAYSLLSFDKPQNLSAIKAHDQQNQVVHIGSLSSYAGKNFRAGWLVAPPAVTAKLADVRLMMDAGLSVLPQILAKEYLEQTAAEHLPIMRLELARRAARLKDLLESLFSGELDLLPTRGGIFTYALMNKKDDESYSSLQSTFLRNGLLPALGESFGDPRKAFRLNHGLFNV